MSKRDEVEAFLAGEVRHRLPTAAGWVEVNRDGEYRLRLPVEVEGELRRQKFCTHLPPSG